MESNDLNSSGMQNPIFEIMNMNNNNNQNEYFDNFSDNINNSFEFENENMMQNIILPPPIIPNKTNKKYSKELIDKMFVTLKDFKINIQKMMDTTNNMIQAININEDKTKNINLRFSLLNKGIILVTCKLSDKFSEVVGNIYEVNGYKILPIYHPSPISPKSYKGNVPVFEKLRDM